MFLYASASGSLKNKTDHEVETLIEIMAQNEYRANAKKKKRGVYGVSDTTSILANQVMKLCHYYFGRHFHVILRVIHRENGS